MLTVLKHLHFQKELNWIDLKLLSRIMFVLFGMHILYDYGRSFTTIRCFENIPSDCSSVTRFIDPFSAQTLSVSYRGIQATMYVCFWINFWSSCLLLYVNIERVLDRKQIYVQSFRIVHFFKREIWHLVQAIVLDYRFKEFIFLTLCFV